MTWLHELPASPGLTNYDHKSKSRDWRSELAFLCYSDYIEEQSDGDAVFSLVTVSALTRPSARGSGTAASQRI